LIVAINKFSLNNNGAVVDAAQLKKFKRNMPPMRLIKE
jgi:hypothetical protein